MTSGRLKLLQLVQTNSADPRSGTELRNYYIARELAKFMDVTHLGFYRADEPAATHAGWDGTRVRLVPQPPSYTLGKLVRGALGKTPAGLLNFRSAAMAAALREELATCRYDIVQLEGIEMAAYLPLIESARHRPSYVVLDWHNIESELAARQALHGKTILHRLYMRRAVGQLRAIEPDLLRRCDRHLVTSGREAARFRRVADPAKIMVVENGVDTAAFAPIVPASAGEDGASRTGQGDRLVFVGSMDYSANIDAVLYFVRAIWPAIRRDFPTLRFTVVGRNPPRAIRALAADQRIEVTGTVADVRPYYQRALAAVVPLRIAGGTRLKVLEAMAAGVPVVSTSAGVEGLRLRPGVHFSLADSAAGFGRAIAELQGTPLARHRIASAGRRLVVATYDWKSVCAAMVTAYRAMLGRAVLPVVQEAAPASADVVDGSPAA